jgi:type III restriction enzyme
VNGAFEPRPYQAKAIESILEQVLAGLNAHRIDPTSPPRRVVLRSPTGSGKTAMMTDVFRRLATQATEFDLAGVWIAPNKLHDQARASAYAVAGGAVSAVLRDQVGATLDANEVLFINWESLNKGDASSFRQENERGEYLRALVESARVVGRDVIVVIDESHRNLGTRPSLDVLDEIRPAVVVEMSATIKGATVTVDRKNVVDEGMVRSEVVANLGVTDGMSSEDFLDLALAKRAELRDAYVSRGSRVNPLLVVQIPDGKRGDQELVALVHALADRGITAISEKNPDGRLVVWLSDQKSLADRRDPRLISNEGPIEVLVCKQAIAVGWDCPRAQVLYKIRSKSETDTFDVQTVGRILRSAEPWLRKPYRDLSDTPRSIADLLDRAYVYHHDRDYEADEDYGLRTAFAYLQETVVSPHIDTHVLIPNVARIGPEQIREAVSLAFSRLGLIPGATRHVDLDARGEAETMSGSSTTEEGRKLTGGHLVHVLRSEPQIQAVFSALVASWAGGSAEGGMMKDEIYWQLRPLGVSVEQTQSAFIEPANAKVIESEMLRAIAEIRERDGLSKSRIASPFTWSLESQRAYNTKQSNDDGESALHVLVEDPDGIYAYSPCYLRSKRSKPEVRFESWLLGRADIVAWWVKNGETAKRDFSIVYDDGNGISGNFFPDYIVGFRDGVVGLYETKDDTAFTGRDAAENRAKAAALAAFAGSNPALEGLFVLVGGSILFYDDPDGNPRSSRTIEQTHGGQ